MTNRIDELRWRLFLRAARRLMLAGVRLIEITVAMPRSERRMRDPDVDDLDEIVELARKEKSPSEDVGTTQKPNDNDTV